MRISIDRTRWWETPLAALIFFTRLPFWRIAEPDKGCYRRVVEYWPLAGWLTGGVMAGTLYGASLLFPYPIAVILAIAMRLSTLCPCSARCLAKGRVAPEYPWDRMAIFMLTSAVIL